MTARVLRLEDAKRIVEAAIGRPDSVRGGESDYRCPQCPKKGFARRSHLHINWHASTPKCLCHQCGAGAKTLEGVVRVVLGYVPENAYRSIDSVNFGEDIDDLLYGDGVSDDDTADHESVSMPEHFTLLTESPKDRLGKLVLEYLTGHDAERKQRGIKLEKLLESGVGYCTEGFCRGYAVFPVVVEGTLTTWTSRRVVGFGPKQRHAKNSRAKYSLFNYDNCLDAKRVFVVEGPFDAWALHRRIRKTDGAVATLGTLVHDPQASALAELPCEEIIMCYDQDAIGKAHKAADKLAKLCDKRLSVVELPDVRDPDEIPFQELKSLVNSRVVRGELNDILRLVAV